MKYFPLFLDLDDKPVILAGSGRALDAKLVSLVRTGARLEVYSDAPTRRMQSLQAEGRIALAGGLPPKDRLARAALVYLGDANVSVTRALRARCQALGVLTNTVDDAGASDFISAAIVDRAPVVVAIGSEGTAPVLVRWIKSRIEALLDADTGAVARLAGQLRPLVRSRLAPAVRLRFWREFFGGDAAARIRRLGPSAARRSFRDTLHEQRDDDTPRYPVALVGAGPGDPDLLTLRARRALETADVVLYDRLVDSRIVDLARREAELIEVGKRPGGRSWRQDDINQALVDHARAGRRVVRLKSGDPMIFGRGDEELDAITAAGLGWDIVPGITAAAAAAATLGRSLTRRGRNSSFKLLTAQDVDGFAEHDWQALARTGATAAIYMGVRAARFFQGRLLLHGAAPDTPISVVENASRPQQRVLATTLAEVAGALDAEAVSGPAIIFLGLAPRETASALETIAPSAHATAV